MTLNYGLLNYGLLKWILAQGWTPQQCNPQKKQRDTQTKNRARTRRTRQKAGASPILELAVARAGGGPTAPVVIVLNWERGGPKAWLRVSSAKIAELGLAANCHTVQTCGCLSDGPTPVCSRRTHQGMQPSQVAFVGMCWHLVPCGGPFPRTPTATRHPGSWWSGKCQKANVSSHPTKVACHKPLQNN